MCKSKKSNYGEKYLRYVHLHGYPTEADRKNFNSAFYVQFPSRDRRYVMDIAYKFHSSMKTRTMPFWLKSFPALHKIFDDALADYQRKYEKRPLPNVVTVDTKRNVAEDDDEPVFLKEERRRSRNRNQIKRRIEEIKKEVDGEEIIMLDDSRQWQWSTPIIQVKQETNDFPLSTTEHNAYENGQPVEKRLAQLEKSLIISQEQLLKEQRTTSELKSQIIADKERTIQILSTFASRVSL